MSRTITVWFPRDTTRDRWREGRFFAGYRMLWPDGREVNVGLEAFCRYRERLLGLDQHLAGAFAGSRICLDLAARPAAEPLPESIQTEEGLHS